MRIGFNHGYYLRHDNNRTILASYPHAIANGEASEWISRIHPIHAMFLSLFSVPLSESQLNKFKQFDIRLQISFDSFDPDVLIKTLKVKESYADRILRTIEAADQLNLKYQIATVLTKETATVDNVTNLYQFLCSLKNLKRWTVRLAFKSLYPRSPYEIIQVSETVYNTLSEWYKSLKDTHNSFNIDFPESYKEKCRYASGGSKDFEGPSCSANMSHMVILPDGKVTICEQLYWQPYFIIGDIYKQTIEEIWNSPRALELAKFPQIHVDSKSPCSGCRIYESCRDFSNKCIINIMRTYGISNWTFPDPRCVKAPPIDHEA